LHHPVSKRFPTVSAQDVGRIAAQLLTDGVTVSAPRVVLVEGPRRYDSNDIRFGPTELRDVFTSLLGR
jgi:NAD(P)H dehydrogenase (quinone)